MGSSAQVIVGGLLLVTAFLFGRYINEQPIIPSKKDQVATMAQDLPLKPTAPQSKTREMKPNALSLVPGVSKSAVETEPNKLQRSLRDRILGQRQQRQENRSISNPTGAAHDSNNFEPKSLAMSDQQIAVPDFSHLEREPVANRLPAKRKIEPIEPFELPELKPSVSESSPPMPFKDSRGVVVGPMPTSPAAQIDGNSTNRFERYFQSPQDRPRKTQAVTKRGSFNQSGTVLVPVRHRESRLTTEATRFVEYTTVFGDTLHGLSTHFFGKPDYYLDIYLANKEKFENPAQVPVNTALRIPVMAELVNHKKK